MRISVARTERIAPSAATASALAGLFVSEYHHDAPRVALPRPEPQLIARFGPAARDGLDVHVLGMKETAHRKVIRSGQRAVAARLSLGATERVLGVPASAVVGQIVPLEDLWGKEATRQLLDRLAHARGTLEAAKVLEDAVAERHARAERLGDRAQLAVHAAALLARTAVGDVAAELGVSDRHLRRVFHDVVGLSPKAFAKLVRFNRALRAAREERSSGWANIAAAAGYYDQAHLIAEFRAIAGVTPRALLDELREDLEPIGH